jgi:protein-S-isoprenylcysteine O-methyltransferase Ste14
MYSMSNLYVRGIVMNVVGIGFMLVCLFLPAGTLDYWQGWALFGVFMAGSLAVGLYLFFYDRELLKRRMHLGPAAETEPTQKIIVGLIILSFIALPVFAVLDHRFGWSSVPADTSILGDALIVLAFVIFVFVLKQNTYSASTIQVEKGQTVISTGLYAYVRHPMYAGALIMVIAMPIALGSWWGLFFLLFTIPVLVWRLLDEERFLHKNLTGYTAYTEKMRYRLVPYVW